MQAVGNDFGFAFAKFAFYEIFVIKFLIGVFAFRGGPAGGFVGTAFGAGGGAWWDGCAAVFAVVGSLRKGGGH